ncbi:hypothetical protein [Streptomyces millisiae]|uniref:Uncharacterized protein n=1 Tax=Streptomyces millisiae TaxID=3075542 RepID=A0ABU2LM80_9ACTN|nr:hypothetical protein [Streptomyces sp. DSM 44918]MDT0318691.1 hypothetical protein [Streptomyces sp. DSM 44918]
MNPSPDAAYSLATLVQRLEAQAEELLVEELPWLGLLPKAERSACVRELLAGLRAGAETGSLLPFAHDVASWRATAEAWADPELARDLQGPFPGTGPELTPPGETPTSAIFTSEDR